MDNKRMMYTSEDVCMCKTIKKIIDDAIDELYQYAKEEATTFNDLANKIIQIQRVFLLEENWDMDRVKFIKKHLKMRMENEIKDLPLNRER